MNITFERAAREVRAGQTVLCEGVPSLVYRAFTANENGMVFLTFFVPNAENIIQWVLQPYDKVTVAPLVRVG